MSMRPSSARLRSTKLLALLAESAASRSVRAREPVEAAEVGIDQAPDPERRPTLMVEPPLLGGLEQLVGVLVGDAPRPSAALELGEKQQGLMLGGLVAASNADGECALQSLARRLVLVCIHQPQALHQRRRDRRGEGLDRLLELERALEHAGCDAGGDELRQARCARKMASRTGSPLSSTT